MFENGPEQEQRKKVVILRPTTFEQIRKRRLREAKKSRDKTPVTLLRGSQTLDLE